MNTAWSPTKVTDVATIILNAVNAALGQTAAGSPERVTLTPGSEIPWDDCSCGLLSLAVTNRYVSRLFPVSAVDLPTNCCDTNIVAEMSLAIIRCVPGPGENGQSPTPEDMAAAFAVQESDAYTVWTAVECALDVMYQATNNIMVFGFIINDQLTVGAEGGCAGTELHFKVGWTYPCPSCG